MGEEATQAALQPPRQGERVLFYGIGNPGRQDDALGVCFIEELQKSATASKAEFDSNYQLNVEDALLISEYDVVVFVDASVEKGLQGPCKISRVEPLDEVSFSSHEMSVGGVLGLCHQLYGRKPRTFLIAIPGFEWGLCEGLSEGARRNLAQALEQVSKWLGVL